jgi:ribose/xylose/arabinose/galactoside ABC-type transport system permease subunit
MTSRATTTKFLSTTGVPIAIVLVLAVVLFQILSPVFLHPQPVRDYLTNAIPILLITVGVAVVIMAGGIDLSVGTVAGLSTATSLWTLDQGGNTVLAILVGLVTGLVFGLINGLLVTRLGINDFIVTLATLNIAAGLLVVLVETTPLQGIATPSFSSLVSGSILGIPTSFWIAAVIFVIIQFVVSSTTLGRRIFAAGVSPDAASNAGVDVRAIRLWTFVISGLLAGAAGVLLGSRLSSAQAFLGVGYEFTAIAGAVLGGVSLAGGRGNVWAAVIGGLLLATLQQGLRLNGVDPVYFSIVTAVCIVVGVVFDRAVRSIVLKRLLGRPPEGAPPSPSVRSEIPAGAASTGSGADS